MAVELVSGIVSLPTGLADDFFGWGVKSPAKLNRLLTAGGLRATIW